MKGESVIQTKLSCPNKLDFGLDQTSGTCPEGKFCFEGTTSLGDTCCSETKGNEDQPDFSSIEPHAKPGCNSVTAQYIAEVLLHFSFFVSSIMDNWIQLKKNLEKLLTFGKYSNLIFLM